MSRYLKLVVSLTFFFFNPCLADPLIVAHRGSSFDAPENTLPAFRLAWEQGADGVEGDFLLTKDAQIVCIHDTSTKRLADKNLVVSKSTLQELRALDVGAWKHEKFKGTKIPTISEVFATIPKGKKIFVEVKCGPEIVPFLVKEIRKANLETDQVRLICFNTKVIKSFKENMPNYKAYWLSGFNKKNGSWKPSVDQVITTLQNCKADGLDSQHTIPPEFSKSVIKAGFEWHAWTINDARTAQRLAKRGIDSITTDRPKLIGLGFRR
jgi:glycerophosphoryl diester phosphodiesterase